MQEKSRIRALWSAYAALLIMLTVSMFFVVTYNVFMRFIVNRSVGWADEVARFIFIWLSFLGAVYAYRTDEHVGLGFLIERIRSPRIKTLFHLLQQLTCLVVLGYLAYYGTLAAETVRNISPALGVPMSIVYAVLPVSALLMIFIAAGKMVSIAGRLVTGGESRTTE